jgi:hypothetical protein
MAEWHKLHATSNILIRMAGVFGRRLQIKLVTDIGVWITYFVICQYAHAVNFVLNRVCFPGIRETAL